MNKKISTFFVWCRTRPSWLWLTIILVFSFLLKLLCWYLDPVVSRDGCIYIRLAQTWYDTGIYPEYIEGYLTNWIPPFFLFLIKSLMCLGISAENAGVWANLILGTFTPLLSYGIAYEITQKREIAVCSALLTAVNPSMNAFSIEIQRDMIYLFFAGLTIWLTVAGIRRRKWICWFFAGISCGCAMLTRFETLEFLLIVPFFFLFLTSVKYFSWKESCRYAGIFFTCFILSIVSFSFLMQSQNSLMQTYWDYYQGKTKILESRIPFTSID